MRVRTCPLPQSVTLRQHTLWAIQHAVTRGRSAAAPATRSDHFAPGACCGAVGALDAASRIFRGAKQSSLQPPATSPKLREVRESNDQIGRTNTSQSARKRQVAPSLESCTTRMSWRILAPLALGNLRFPHRAFLLAVAPSRLPGCRALHGSCSIRYDVVPEPIG